MCTTVRELKSPIRPQLPSKGGGYRGISVPQLLPKGGGYRGISVPQLLPKGGGYMGISVPQLPSKGGGYRGNLGSPIEKRIFWLHLI